VSVHQSVSSLFANLQAASTTADATADDKMGTIVEPAVFNKSGVRAGAILLAVSAAAVAGKVCLPADA
jgi:hypothetical protein